MIIIRTAGGKELAITPNHPVLADRGWVAAGALHEGDHLVRDPLFERVAAVHDDYDLVPTRIEEVAHALWQAGQMETREMPVAPEDFHGDGGGSEIAVIRTDGLLRNGWHATSAEQAAEAAFERRLARLHGDPDSAATEGLHRFGVAADGGVRGGNLARPLVGPHERPFEMLSFGSPSRADVGFDEASSDGPAADAERVRERLFGFAGTVATDEIIHIERQPFHGQVWTLETVGGWYIAEGFVVKNCRCAVGLVIVRE